jgi:RND superfamily putative drug exporter
MKLIPRMPPADCAPHRGVFAAIGRFSYRWHWFIVAVWSIAFVLGLVATFYLGDVLKSGGFADKDSPSEQAAAFIKERIDTGFTTLTVVFSSDELRAGGDDFQAAMRRALRDITPQTVPHLKQVVLPDAASAGQLVSADGRTAVVLLVFDASRYQVQRQVEDVRAALAKTPLDATVTGEPAVNADIVDASGRDLRVAESWALPIALIALLFVFGTLVASAMPVICGGMAVTVTLGMLYLLGHWFDVSVYAMNVASLLGLAVGIDYALFIVARFREELAAGATVANAVQSTVAHAGRSVFYSGMAVAIGILGLVFFPFSALQTIGLGGALVVLFSVLAAVTLLPALLGILGPRVNRLRIIRVSSKPSRFWRTWSQWIVRRPILFTVLALACVAIISWPITTARIEMPTATVLPASAESRQGYEVISRGFEMGELSPISVAVSWKGGGSAFDAERLTALWQFGRELQSTPGVESVTSIVNLPGVEALLPLLVFWKAAEPALQSGEPVEVGGLTISEEQIASLRQLVGLTVGDGIAVFRVAPDAEPSSAQASALADRLRAMQPPAGTQLWIAGESAARSDFFAGLYDRFPWVAGIVLGVTYLILVFLSRSLVVPLKAVIVNILTILMAYGVIVFIFQDGRWESILGYTSSGSIDAIMPIIMFCTLFGVSMDYEVFLIARMRETWDRTHDVDASVRSGPQQSGRVIVSAALLVVVIAGSFAFTSISMTKELGIGVAFAILFDALLIRMMLVPASMKLLGRHAWWLPGWLDRILPRLHLEEDADDVAGANSRVPLTLDGRPPARV